jgi:ferredoxin-NADP reductase
MLVKKYRSTIVAINNPIQDIYSVEFASQRGQYKYHPGQFLHLALDTDYDGVGQWPISRCFSMQSPPEKEMLKITYAVKGSFTKQMEQTLKTGTEVWLKLPYGDLFETPHNKEKTVFIAGGTGITPFLSLFNHVSFEEYSNPKVYLGFRTKEYNIYQNELDATANTSVKIYTYFEDVNGIININNIINENSTDHYYFISGPPAMIKAFKQTLMEKGVQADNIITDNWE